MKRSLLFAALMLGLPLQVLAARQESCPKIEQIQHRGGVYTTVDQHWLGISQSGSSAVIGFTEATFYPDGAKNLRGRLNSCSYQLDGGQMLDMRYKRDASSDVIVNIRDNGQWSRQEGPFGIVYHLCKGPDPSVCAFSESQS
ncbi:DUF3757 domain-containing protein [Dyella sp.]|uniref:DUF3757 domain-containing protein n=1 Tax=Dyella sp. TaxID=1869338 RepID=UPI002ED1620E